LASNKNSRQPVPSYMLSGKQGGVMTQYHIRLFRGESLESEGVRNDIPQDTVVKEAKTAVETGRADRAEVRNAQGNLIYQWPRTLHRA
jgi:hypothetical protein